MIDVSRSGIFGVIVRLESRVAYLRNARPDQSIDRLRLLFEGPRKIAAPGDVADGLVLEQARRIKARQNFEPTRATATAGETIVALVSQGVEVELSAYSRSRAESIRWSVRCSIYQTAWPW